eukprot:PhF_6_TR13598/c0_g1_i1/m.21757/K11790/DTL, CDT2, DCAF2; denticleless
MHTLLMDASMGMRTKPSCALTLSREPMVFTHTVSEPHIISCLEPIPGTDRVLLGKDRANIEVMSVFRHKGFTESTNLEFQSMELRSVFALCAVPCQPNHVHASFNNFITTLDLEAQQIIANFVGHRLSVRCIHVNPRNPYVMATGGRDGVISMWDTRCQTTKNCLIAMHEPHKVRDVSHKQRLRATRYTPEFPACIHWSALCFPNPAPSCTLEGLSVFERVHGTPSGTAVVRSTNGGVSGLCWLNDGVTVVSSSSADGTLRVWDTRMMIPAGRAGSDGSGMQDLVIHPVAYVDTEVRDRGIASFRTNESNDYLSTLSIQGVCSVYRICDLYRTTQMTPVFSMECARGSYGVRCSWQRDVLAVPERDGCGVIQMTPSHHTFPSSVVSSSHHDVMSGDGFLEVGGGTSVEHAAWLDESTLVAAAFETGKVKVLSF